MKRFGGLFRSYSQLAGIVAWLYLACSGQLRSTLSVIHLGPSFCSLRYEEAPPGIEDGALQRQSDQVRPTRRSTGALVGYRARSEWVAKTASRVLEKQARR